MPWRQRRLRTIRFRSLQQIDIEKVGGVEAWINQSAWWLRQLREHMERLPRTRGGKVKIRLKRWIEWPADLRLTAGGRL